MNGAGVWCIASEKSVWFPGKHEGSGDHDCQEHNVGSMTERLSG
jgi:hypothetical protein